jgi:hypothetical protein
MLLGDRPMPGDAFPMPTTAQQPIPTNTNQPPGINVIMLFVNHDAILPPNVPPGGYIY